MIVVLEVVIVAVLVPVAVAGALVAVVDRRMRLLRLALMGAGYLMVEMAALAGFLLVWLARPLRSRARSERADLALLAWALGAVLWVARRTVGLEVEIEGNAAPGALAGPDPVVVLARHGGIADSFVLVWLLSARYRLRPRVVLKDLLLWEPLIDVALNRTGACFLPPPGRRPDGLEQRVGRLAETLVEGDALLLFPEGGNWTPRRRLTGIARLWAAGKPAAARAAALMDHVLAPRAGGVLACLDARPDLPVVIAAHTGLDKVTTAGQLWAALPFDRPMTLRWWPAAHPPWGADERVEWLTTEWAVVDEWIDSHQPLAGA